MKQKLYIGTPPTAQGWIFVGEVSADTKTLYVYVRLPFTRKSAISIKLTSPTPSEKGNYHLSWSQRRKSFNECYDASILEEKTPAMYLAARRFFINSKSAFKSLPPPTYANPDDHESMTYEVVRDPRMRPGIHPTFGDWYHGGIITHGDESFAIYCAKNTALADYQTVKLASMVPRPAKGNFWLSLPPDGDGWVPSEESDRVIHLPEISDAALSIAKRYFESCYQ